MDEVKYRRVLVWSGWLRLSHAAIVFAVPVLLLTGWLLAQSPSLAETALDVHYLASSLLVFGCLIRIVLLFAGREHERLQALIPATGELPAMAGTLRFYISMGRSPAHGWYAQNPLWKPVYLLMYLALILLVATGMAMPENDVVFGFYLPSVHLFWAQLLLWLVVFHIASVLLHDYRRGTTDISAMVNGYRLFLLEDNKGETEAGTVQLVSVDSLQRRE